MVKTHARLSSLSFDRGISTQVAGFSTHGVAPSSSIFPLTADRSPLDRTARMARTTAAKAMTSLKLSRHRLGSEFEIHAQTPKVVTLSAAKGLSRLGNHRHTRDSSLRSE